MASPVPVSKIQSQNKRRLVGFRKLPWHIVENILLQKAISYPDVVSFIKAYAPNPHYKKIIASVGRFQLLWEKKFKQSYPDLYRILLGSGIAGHETFTWYHLLKKRWDTGQSVAKSLKAFRDKNMEETIALLYQQEDNLVNWLTESQPSAFAPIQTDVETGITSTHWEHDEQEHQMPVIAFVGNGCLADNNFHSRLHFLLCNRALANMILGDHADRYVNIHNPVPHDEVPLLTKLMVVDACRDHAQNIGVPKMADGPTYDMLNTMKMCQTAVGYHQCTEQLTEMPFRVRPNKGVPEDFFALINFLQACYPQCTDILTNFYKNAFGIRNITIDFSKGVMATINGMVRKLEAPLIVDDLAFACGFACNFPNITICLPPIVTFLFLAHKYLSNEFVTVTMDRLTLEITVKDAENVCTDWDDIYMLVPCVRVDGIYHCCIPNKGSKDVEIFTDHVKLATALHRRLFSEAYRQFGTVREVKIISVTQGSLMDHFRSYMKYLATTKEYSRTRTLQSVYTQSEPYGGSLVEEFCQLFTNSGRKELMPHFLLYHTWLTSHGDSNGRNYYLASSFFKCNPPLPVGTVVRIKYRDFTPGAGAEGPEDFAVVVTWNFSRFFSIDDTDPVPGGVIHYYCVSLGTSDANNPFNTCARNAEKMTVVDELPESVQSEMSKNPTLWRLFDGFDGMFFIPQPALKKKFPNDCTSQKELRKSRAMCAVPRL